MTIKRLILGLVSITIGTWLLGLWLVPPAYNARSWVHEVYFVNGVLAWVFMAFCLVTAARPAWLERFTKTPLDELYVYHRVLGWWALVLSFVHYFTKPLIHPVISLLSLPRPEKIQPLINPDLWDAFWKSLRPIANTSAQWLTWSLLVICLLAVVRAVGYTCWLAIHKVLAVVFLGLTLHCVRLMETSDFMTPFGWWNLTVTLVGSWAALKILFNRAGLEKTVTGTLVTTETIGHITRWRIRTSIASTVLPGQFVFVIYEGERHPFSITSIRKNEIELVIKHLGDFTTNVVPSIEKGTQINIEGPYGFFSPNFELNSQTWIATGIGIAPFLAWLNHATQHNPNNVTLHWCIKDKTKEPLMVDISQTCEAVGVHLKIYESKYGRATVDDLLLEKTEGLAVCGNSHLAKTLRKGWKGEPNYFQTEYFEWRHG